MRCARVRKRLSAYQDSALGAAERAVILGHLAQCAACRTRLDELQRTRDLLDLSGTADPSPGFVTGVLRRVQVESPWPAWQAPRWSVAAGLALSLALGGAVGYVHSSVQPPSRKVQVALAADVSEKLGVEAFAPAPTDTLAGAYTQLTGVELER
jgi:predicted anti-sigma-YlaC factor YlaD